MTEINKMSSEELKQAISNVPIDEGGQDFDTPGGYEFEDDSGEGFESEGKPESAEAYAKRIWQEQTEEEAQAAREAEQERQQATLDYLEGRARESGGEEAFMGNLQSAMASDFQDLRDKYASVSDIIERFGYNFSRGKIKISERDLMNDDAPQESAFLKWVSKPSVMRDLSVDQIKEIIEIGAKGQPLRSKSKAIIVPQAMHPVPKKTKPR